MNLDRPELYGSVDRDGALADVTASADQWAQAHARATATLDLAGADGVVVAGMGGSGITGDVVAALAEDRLGVPVVVHKGYGLPGWVGARTQVVAVSASGGTEETLSAVDEAVRRRARVFVVTSGGALGERCERVGLPWTRIPGTLPPRHSLGWLVVPVLVALGLDDGLEETLRVQSDLAGAWGGHTPTGQNPAKQLGGRAAVAAPVVWGAQGLGVVAATRLACQLNENAKVPATWSALPELCHNAVVGWDADPPSAAGLVVWRDHPGESPRLAARIDASVRLVSERFAWVEQPQSVGVGPLARLASMVLRADLASLYAALAGDRDPTPIDAIDRLKKDLGE